MTESWREISVRMSQQVLRQKDRLHNWRFPIGPTGGRTGISDQGKPSQTVGGVVRVMVTNSNFTCTWTFKSSFSWPSKIYQGNLREFKRDLRLIVNGIWTLIHKRCFWGDQSPFYKTTWPSSTSGANATQRIWSTSPTPSVVTIQSLWQRAGIWSSLSGALRLITRKVILQISRDKQK